MSKSTQLDVKVKFGLKSFIAVVGVRFERENAHRQERKEVGALRDLLFHAAYEHEKGYGDGAAAHTHTGGDTAEKTEQ